MITNYGELQATIKKYLYNRKNLDGDIKTFISIAEKKMFRALRCPENERQYTEEVAEGLSIPEITEPSDFLEIKFLNVNGKPMKRISDLALQTELATDYAPGEPSKFARVLDKYVFWRIPDSNYKVDLYYWTDFSDTPLVLDDDTNAVLLAYPDLYLYGALLEAMPFLVDDQRLTTWQAMYQQALDYIDHRTKEQEYSGSPVSVGGIYSDG